MSKVRARGLRWPVEYRAIVGEQLPASREDAEERFLAAIQREVREACVRGTPEGQIDCYGLGYQTRADATERGQCAVCDDVCPLRRACRAIAKRRRDLRAQAVSLVEACEDPVHVWRGRRKRYRALDTDLQAVIAWVARQVRVTARGLAQAHGDKWDKPLQWAQAVLATLREAGDVVLADSPLGPPRGSRDVAEGEGGVATSPRPRARPQRSEASNG